MKKSFMYMVLFMFGILLVMVPMVSAKKAPTPILSPATITLQGGATNPGFVSDDNNADCGPDPKSAFAWHFILTPTFTNPGSLSATFDGGFPVSIQGPYDGGGSDDPWTKSSAHYWVYTAGSDTLTTASVDVDSCRNCNLVLSHICFPEEEIPEFPTAAIPIVIALGGYLAIRRLKA
jgi:hypothetical protein